LEYYTYEDGMVVFRGRLPAEVGACVIEALETAMDSLREGDVSPAGPAGVGDDSAESSGVFGPGSDGELLESQPAPHGDDRAESAVTDGSTR